MARPESSKGVHRYSTPFEDSGRATQRDWIAATDSIKTNLLFCKLLKNTGHSSVNEGGAEGRRQEKMNLPRTLRTIQGLSITRPDELAVPILEAAMQFQRWFYLCERNAMGQQAEQCGHSLPYCPLRL